MIRFHRTLLEGMSQMFSLISDAHTLDLTGKVHYTLQDIFTAMSSHMISPRSNLL